MTSTDKLPEYEFPVLVTLQSEIIELEKTGMNYLIATCESGFYKLYPDGYVEAVTWQ